MDELNSTTIPQFIIAISKGLKHRKWLTKDVGILKQTILSPSQALFVLNYQLAEITFSRNTEAVLGYDANEFSMQLINHEILHPNQCLIVSIILKAAIEAGIKGVFNPDEVRFSLIHKARHKNGDYRLILRQTGIFETDEDGKLISSYSSIIDLSSLFDLEKVTWELQGVNPEIIHSISRKIRHQANIIFSEKELLVLAELKKGKSSKEIAEKFNNSKHTIDTHRRKLLSKSNCRNTLELINFAESLSI